ncbi:MAG TPA: HAMP domain-containing sensor histidine kinase [Ferruginibacter sp.]|nr:HAMP domain-containing sensor histidine kinase [Ferruginibacter sp.]
MRPPTFKTIVLSSAITIVVIVAMQFLWLSRVSDIYDEAPQHGTSVRDAFNLWIIVACLLMLLLVGMAVILVYFYRQRYRQEAQKDFLNNFMHEFKTPLAVMGIAGKVLQSPGIEQQTTRLKKYAAIVKEQSEQLENKVNRILEVALSERKQVVLAKNDLDVNAMVLKAIGFLQPLIDERGAVIEFTPGTEHLRIHADGVYMQQVMINLLDNALKYANARPRVTITATHTEKMCTISVNDHGIGIEKKYHKDIFRKFFRVPTGNVHNVKGFGIGLNFAKKVVDAHQGKIEVESSIGIGSKFSIHMPLI